MIHNSLFRLKNLKFVGCNCFHYFSNLFVSLPKAKPMNSKWSIHLLILFGSITCNAQLVNIESMRMQTDSLRFVFRGNLLTNYSNNNGVYFLSIRSNVVTQFKTKDLNKIFFLIGDYNLLKSENQDFENAWFLHFRYNHEITRLFRLEGLIQTQQNKILDVNTRNLLGAGVRLKLVSQDSMSLYFGNTYLYEVERSDELGINFKNHRHSTYVSATILLPGGAVELINTIYYQPLYNDFDDYRILEQFRMDVKVSEKVNLFTIFDYSYDSITPREREQFSSVISLGLGLKL